jgi:putative peptide zinc metalloprotease protein
VSSQVEWGCLFMAEVYRMREGVDVLRLDSSLPDKPLLVVAGSRHLQVSGVAKEVLLCLRERPASSAEVYTFVRRSFGMCTQDHVQGTLRALGAEGVLEIPSSLERRQGRDMAERSGRRGYFLFQIPLLPGRVLLPITSRISALFNLQLMAWLFPTMLLAHAFLGWFFFGRFRQMALSLRGWDFALLLAGNYLGLFVHELGHASACVRCGAPHGPIGVGLYLIFPAFYANVTPAWRLPRLHRVIVDAGGIYTSLFAATAAAVLYCVTHRSVFAVLTAIYQATVWISLWPFVRMDGYWAISDFLGVPNLMSANRELTTWVGQRILGRPSGRPRVLLIEPRWIRNVYLLYYALFILSMCLMLFGLLRWYLPALARFLPGVVHGLVVQIKFGGLSLTVLSALLRILAVTVPLLGPPLYMLRRLVSMVNKGRQRHWCGAPGSAGRREGGLASEKADVI